MQIFYAVFTTILFLLLKVFTGPKAETKVLVKEAVFVFISSILGSYIAGKIGIPEIKNVIKSAPVFTDNAGF